MLADFTSFVQSGNPTSEAKTEESKDDGFELVIPETKSDRQRVMHSK